MSKEMGQEALHTKGHLHKKWSPSKLLGDDQVGAVLGLAAPGLASPCPAKPRLNRIVGRVSHGCRGCPAMGHCSPGLRVPGPEVTRARSSRLTSPLLSRSRTVIARSVSSQLVARCVTMPLIKTAPLGRRSVLVVLNSMEVLRGGEGVALAGWLVVQPATSQTAGISATSPRPSLPARRRRPPLLGATLAA